MSTPPNRLTAKYNTIRKQALLAIANDLGNRVCVNSAKEALDMISDLDTADGNLKTLEKVAREAVKLFQSGGYFEHCVGSKTQAKLQQALKEAGYL